MCLLRKKGKREKTTKRRQIMKKKLLAVLLTGVMAMSMLTACGSDAEETAVAEEAEEEVTEAADGACSDETFAILQDNFVSLTDAYNAVKELYEMNEIAADADIEDAINSSADIINEMGEITQDSITEEDAATLNDTMITLLEVLDATVDGMEVADDSAEAADESCSDETFVILQDNFASLTDAYNAVVEAYNSDEVEADADIEATLTAAEEVISQMGEITQDSITEEDAASLNDSMLTILEVLQSVVDAM